MRVQGLFSDNPILSSHTGGFPREGVPSLRAHCKHNPRSSRLKFFQTGERLNLFFPRPGMAGMARFALKKSGSVSVKISN